MFSVVMMLLFEEGVDVHGVVGVACCWRWCVAALVVIVVVVVTKQQILVFQAKLRLTPITLNFNIKLIL